ncbi:MAG: polyprenyl diphosphate synthase [Polyangia bacterium]
MTSSAATDLPRHVAIIMDGNGRWAESRGLPRVAGHHEGAKAVKRTVTACRERGIRVLTLFAFSSQNWSRPSAEVDSLMRLLGQYVRLERRSILENGIRLTVIGNISSIPEAPRKILLDLVDESSGNSEMTLCLALSYGGLEEIAAAARDLAERASRGEIDPSQIDVGTFSSALESHQLGPVDLMIRTSGELRISNFLLFGIAYAELFFTDCMWPAFDEQVLDRALQDFAARHRRFGRVG